MNRDFAGILHELNKHEQVRRMKNYTQHGRTSTYRHCLSVAKGCYRLSRALGLSVSIPTLVEGAMLHDFYLYDWHHADDGTHRWHGFIHAERARRNACAYLHVSPEVEHVIACHMWPMNPRCLPHSREAWLVWLVDKAVALRETFSRNYTSSL